MLVLAGVMWAGLDQCGSGALIFICVIAGLVVTTLHAFVLVPLIAASELLLSVVLPGWDVDFWAGTWS